MSTVLRVFFLSCRIACRKLRRQVRREGNQQPTNNENEEEWGEALTHVGEVIVKVTLDFDVLECFDASHG